MQNAQIGALVAKVELDLTKLSDLLAGDSPRPNAVDLRASWSALVAHLAIEPAPATRACPKCGGTIMRDATRCMHCWAQSAPPDVAPHG
jgi:hypothetical protein